MRIAIIGHGKMGRELEAVAIERGHQIALIVDKDNIADLNAQNARGIDVALEFTSPQTAYKNVRQCLAIGLPVVCGTTGWNDQLPELAELAQKGEGALFYASNFSVGMHIFFKINALAARCMATIGGYDVAIKETHHTQKLDAPSGTAIAMANVIAAENGAVDGWTLLPERCNGKIPIEAIREGQVFGNHEVVYASACDVITVEHKAKGRRGLALGAVMAAEFTAGKRGFFGMDDLIPL
ncbi:MAG: 4-hydroxy-tetrahydrodipicolinate reductase [Bacteroidales bacterium]|nr:4-hydroxy-tetrahydrodipicolinate reductase [Bacteroidales bacterium]